MRILGIDLAWATNKKSGVSNETGVVAVGLDGTVVDAGWTRGLDHTLDWMEANAGVEAFAMIDAPLVVTNASGQRACEKHTGQRYGKWKVSANSTNLASRNLGGLELRLLLDSADGTTAMAGPGHQRKADTSASAIRSQRWSVRPSSVMTRSVPCTNGNRRQWLRQRFDLIGRPSATIYLPAWTRSL